MPRQYWEKHIVFYQTTRRESEREAEKRETNNAGDKREKLYTASGHSQVTMFGMHTFKRINNWIIGSF